MNISPDRLVRENIKWMLNLAQNILRDRGLAEDATQDALISAINSIHKFKQQSSLRTWLHRITVNAALAKLRQNKTSSNLSLEEHLPEFDSNACRIEPAWGELREVQEVVESEQLQSIIHNYIDQLHEMYRIVLLLRDIEGYSTKEVAQVLSLTEATVKIRLHRARAVLKKLLEPVLRQGEIL